MNREPRIPSSPEIASRLIVAIHAAVALIAAQGVVISEFPPGTTPMRRRFLLRNRTIAALASGTLVVEAAAHSGTVSGARAHSRSRCPVTVKIA